MNLNPEYQDRLERLIDQELKRLPQLPVPDSLLDRVKAAIEEEQSKPWWQKPWPSWPRSIQVFFLVSLFSLAGSIVYALSIAPTDLPTQWVGQKFSGTYAALDTLINVFATLLNALLLLVQTASSNWLVVAVAAAAVLYAASVVLGVAWFRVALSRREFHFKFL